MICKYCDGTGVAIDMPCSECKGLGVIENELDRKIQTKKSK